MLDQHGYVTPTLIESTTKPHNPSIDYDLWLKWNQTRIDANEAAMNAVGLAVTRPILDWCANGAPPPASGLCANGFPRALPGRGLGRLGALLHADVLAARRAERLNGRNVQLDRHRAAASRADHLPARPPRIEGRPVHRRLVDAALRPRRIATTCCGTSSRPTGAA